MEQNQELYDHIYASFIKHRRVETPEEQLFVHELTREAMWGAQEYVKDLEESAVHLKETIRRLSKEV